MKVARGNVKKLLIGIGKIQHWIGSAKGYHGDDRDRNGFEKGQKLLEKAFKECVRLTGDYHQVEEAADASETE